MLKTKGTDLKGKVCLISGSGNVAQYTAEKVLELGGKVVTMSDSDGYIYDPDGIDRAKLDYIMELKNLYRGRIREYAETYGCKYVEGAPGVRKAISHCLRPLRTNLTVTMHANWLPTVSWQYPKVPTCLLLQKLSKCSRMPRSCMLRAKQPMRVVYPFQDWK